MSETKTWGIHKFSGARQGNFEVASYFMERPFGNLIVFKLPEDLDIKKELVFMESKGGVAIQYCCRTLRPNEPQRKVYQRFGAPYLVAHDSEELNTIINEDYSFRYALYGEDYVEANSRYLPLLGTDGVIVNQKDTQFVFLPEPFMFDRGSIKMNFQDIEEQEIRKALPPKEKTILFFQIYRGLNWYEL